MKIVFMGTPVFAQVPLERLYDEGYDLAAVFTQPDKPRSRGLKVTFSPVKECAIAHGTPVYQPSTLRDGTAAEIIRSLGCDLIVVVAYGRLLPNEILDIPPLGAINIHGSLLPMYRGAAPIQWAILRGESETGLTSMYISEQLDSGDILLTTRTKIGEKETAGDLISRLSHMGAELLSETLKAISSGEAVRIKQNHDEATFAPPLTKEMSQIDWSGSARSIINKIRGLNPWPVATTAISGRIFKIYSAEQGSGSAAFCPGVVVSTGKQGIEIACGDGSIIIKELQAPGGKRMSSYDYLRGNPVDCT